MGSHFQRQNDWNLFFENIHIKFFRLIFKDERKEENKEKESNAESGQHNLYGFEPIISI